MYGFLTSSTPPEFIFYQNHFQVLPFRYYVLQHIMFDNIYFYFGIRVSVCMKCFHCSNLNIMLTKTATKFKLKKNVTQQNQNLI